MNITRTNNEVVIDITSNEFNEIGTEAVLKLLNLNTIKAETKINVDIFKDIISKDIATGGSHLNKAFEGRYGAGGIQR